MVTTQNGKNIATDAYNCYQVILMQITFFMYLKNTNVQVIQSLTILALISSMGMALIFNDEYMVGPHQFITCPVLLMQLLLQILVLSLRNYLTSVLSLLLIKRYSNLSSFYADVEERLSFEQFEDPN